MPALRPLFRADAHHGAQLIPARVQAYIDWFAGLRVETLDATEIRFVDPFNDVRGRAALRRLLGRMFEEVEAPRFEIVHRVGDGRISYVRWRFHGTTRRSRCIDGVSETTCDGDGLSVPARRWDAAGQVL